MASTPRKLTPFQQFCNGLRAAKVDVNETMDELLAFAEVMANKGDAVEMDENGMFYTSATGDLEEVIYKLKLQLAKLERVKQQKDNQR